MFLIKRTFWGEFFTSITKCIMGVNATSLLLISKPKCLFYKYMRFCMCVHIHGIYGMAALVRTRVILWNDNVALLSSCFPFAYLLLRLKVKFAINTMVLHKVSAPGCICTVKATRYAIHHWNDSFEISAQCIDKWFSLGYKTGTKNKKKKKKTGHCAFFPCCCLTSKSAGGFCGLLLSPAGVRWWKFWHY